MGKSVAYFIGGCIDLTKSAVLDPPPHTVHFAASLTGDQAASSINNWSTMQSPASADSGIRKHRYTRRDQIIMWPPLQAEKVWLYVFDGTF